MARTDDVTVGEGSRVRIREDGGPERVLWLRGTDPATWAPNSISVDTPLGRALLGHKVGDHVEAQAHPILPVRNIAILAID
jgi:transcription elongation GreA/GreB family factor